MRAGYLANHTPTPSPGRVPRVYAACLPSLVLAATIAACDAPDGDMSTARETTPSEYPGNPYLGGDAETSPSNSLTAGYLAEARFAEADFERGELLSFTCIVCHTLGPGEGHLIGPNLSGVFGRPAASAPDFPYSDALREAGIVWTPAELDAWLARPDDYVPGNLMVFAGIYSVSDRTDLLAYLLRETAEGEFGTTR